MTTRTIAEIKRDPNGPTPEERRIIEQVWRQVSAVFRRFVP